MNSTLVFGHLNPDTDSVCSAISYAWHLTTNRKQPAEAVVTGSLSREAQFVLEHFGLEAPRRIDAVSAEDQIVIIDTNNPEELVAGHAEATLLEIVDHHKLTGGLSTSSPVTVTLRPVACTATIIFSLMGKQELPAKIAGCLVAAIISDTLLFTSPTTTEEDRLAAKQLAETHNIDLEKLAEAMFAAKSDLTGLSPLEITTMDSKVAILQGKKIRVGSLETTSVSHALALREKLEEAMRQLKEQENLDGAFLFIIDILKSNATLLVPSDFERQVASQAFALPFTGPTLELPGVVSRKKQIMPALERALTA